MTFETNGLKALYFQGVETKRFQHGVNMMSTCTALPPRVRTFLTKLTAFFAPCCRERWLIFETNGLKGTYFQSIQTVEIQALSTRGSKLMSHAPPHPVVCEPHFSKPGPPSVTVRSPTPARYLWRRPSVALLSEREVPWFCLYFPSPPVDTERCGARFVAACVGAS